MSLITHKATKPNNGACDGVGNGYATCSGKDGILRYVCSPSGGTSSVNTACNNHIYDRPCGNVQDYYATKCPSQCKENENLFVCDNGIAKCGQTKDEACNSSPVITSICKTGEELYICPASMQAICIPNNTINKNELCGVLTSCIKDEELKKCPDNSYVCGKVIDNNLWKNYCKNEIICKDGQIKYSCSNNKKVCIDKNNRPEQLCIDKQTSAFSMASNEQYEQYNTSINKINYNDLVSLIIIIIFIMTIYWIINK
jgi:hypothetical protein